MKRKIRAATEVAESMVRGHRKFVRETWDLSSTGFPGNYEKIALPLPPLSSVVKVNYYNSTNGYSTLSSTAYLTHTPTHAPGWIEPKEGETWPETYPRGDAMKVRFVAGYGTADSVPQVAKEAISVIAESLYDPMRLSMDEAEDIASRLLAKLEYGHYA